MTFDTSDFGPLSLPRGFAKADMDLAKTVYVCPVTSFQHGAFSYPLYEVAIRVEDSVWRFTSSHEVLMDWAQEEGEDLVAHVGKLLEHCESPVQSFAGLQATDRPLIMGIVNVTPDSFSDGGNNYASEDAIAHGRTLLAAGADILDVGGESTRPGAAPVSQEEELRRVLPVIKGLKELGAKISIDTRHAPVMRAAVEAGADIINDVTALEGNGALETAAQLQVPVMLMHMQGEPQTMQDNPVYGDCVLDIYDYLHARVRACEDAGIARHDICVDPGIGFGKTLDHNMQVLNTLGQYHGLGCAVLLGASRKSFIAKICDDVPAGQRLPGSLAAVLKGAEAGVQIVRVHDVAETKQALDVWTY